MCSVICYFLKPRDMYMLYVHSVQPNMKIFFVLNLLYNFLNYPLPGILWGCRAHDRILVGFTTICTLSCEFEPRSWRGVLDTTSCDKVCQ